MTLLCTMLLLRFARFLRSRRTRRNVPNQLS